MHVNEQDHCIDVPQPTPPARPLPQLPTQHPLDVLTTRAQVDTVRGLQRHLSQPASTPQTATIREQQEGGFHQPAATPAVRSARDHVEGRFRAPPNTPVVSQVALPPKPCQEGLLVLIPYSDIPMARAGGERLRALSTCLK
jgi:hypothetical protein